jgi:sortase (surface protein transpeptidase)
MSGRELSPEQKPAPRRRVVLPILLFLLIFGGAVAAGYWFAGHYFVKEVPAGNETTFEARSDLSNEAVTTTERDDYQVAADLPRYLSIPAINVDKARVQQLGIEAGSENRLDSPKNVHDAGWYTASAKPGTGAGAGLYDGHNTGTTERGVFYDLGKLRIGDEIIIERGDGQKFTYAVAENQTQKLEDVDMKRMMESAAPDVEGLNIITCAGTWVSDRNVFDERVLIRAVRQ